ncbi:MAG: signal recognition particle protein [Clostridia bacterium]|nr:signal recognition particle protein [Clostridia bacterium]
MAFESLGEKLKSVFNKLTGRGLLSESDVKDAMRQVRMALLEADVNFKVAKEFVAKVSERCVGAEVMKSLTPGQQVIKIVNEELTALMGSTNARLETASKPPTVIVLCGLQGAGKTTFAGKLARMLKKGGRNPLLAACDLARPAAVEQLKVVGGQVDVPVFTGTGDPVSVAKAARTEAENKHFDTLIVDTAGRLHVDEMLMGEITDICTAVSPTEVLLVADAMTGQDAVNIADAFSKAAPLTGVVLTKMDGDTRGGAALSMKAVTQKPIKFVSVGEKLDQIEVFHPDRMAQRILGMGDIMTLIEKAQQQFDQEKAQEMEAKLRKAEFTLDDYLEQMDQIKEMGGFGEIAGILPQLKGVKMDADDSVIKRTEAIIRSMTPQERHRPEIINSSRRRRIARGSGTQVSDVNRLINDFNTMKKTIKQITRTFGSNKRRFKMPF